MVRRDVIKYECDPVFVALVHHTVRFLIVDLVSFTDFEAVWPTVNHESHTRISAYRHMDSVAMAKGRVSIVVRIDLATGQ